MEPFWRCSRALLYTARGLAERTPTLEGRSVLPPWWEDGTQINFTLEQETKNTVRFAEDEAEQPAAHPGTPVAGTLYLQKTAHATLGSPKQITVAIEAKG